ncbi:MAG: PIN domain-containing protein [Terricaulis sp.]
MIIFDTNVISEMMRASLDPRFNAWLQLRRGEAAATTAVNVYEIQFGLHRLPHGGRRADLEARFERLVGAPGFVILPMTEDAARRAGVMMAIRYAKGQPKGEADMMIAGIAAEASAAIATRNVRDSRGLDLRSSILGARPRTKRWATRLR